MYSKEIRAAAAQTEATTIISVPSEAGDVDKPDYLGAEYRAMLPDVEFVRAVYGGTKTLRALGKHALPKHALEREGSVNEGGYHARLARATAQNMLKRVVNGMVGMIFRKDPILTDVPSEIEADFANIDQQGADLPTFAKRVATHALRDGLTWIHEEAPPPKAPAQVAEGVTRERNAAEAAASPSRPYWVHVDFEDAINWRYDFEDGVPTLKLFVYREHATVEDGQYGQNEEMRYRVLRAGGMDESGKATNSTWEVWVEREDENKQKTWELHDQGTTSLSYIPVDPIFGPERTGAFMASPALLDIAHENLEHYRVRSDYQHALSFASQPVPWITGHDPDQQLAWGAGQLLATENEKAKLGVLESTGASLSASREELGRIEAAVAVLSLNMLVGDANPQPTTATSDLIDKAEGDSELSSFARGLQAALNYALVTHAEYRGVTSPGEIQINRDFSGLVINPQLATMLLDAVVAGKLRQETMWKILQTYEVLPEDFDPDEEAQALEASGGRELSAMAQAMTAAQAAQVVTSPNGNRQPEPVAP